jgi:signal transduction histidine kinase
MSVPPPLRRDHRVIVLPATRRDGEAIEMFLKRHRIDCEICPNEACAAMAIGEEPGALILTDQVLAGEGAHLILEALMAQPAWSDMPVVFLSKVGDESQSMSEMIGRMTNVTLLERPASTRTLLSAVQAALRSRLKQYEIRDQLAALRTAESALRESDRLKNEFLAMLSHELRNPLAPIRTAADLLPRLIAGNDARVTATLDIIGRQIRQLTRLVDDLLDVSRITQGRIEIQRGPVDLVEVVTQALESVEPLLDEKRHTVRLVTNPDLYVEGDRARLVQCVSNILTNAVKYTDAGGEIVVAVSREGPHAVIAIADTGVGIPASLLPRIFDLFVQNERSLDRSEGGLGIGLSVVRRLIEMQGGKVSAASPGSGQGSTFTISLPAIERSVDDQPAAPKPCAFVLRVLIVDDNKDAAESLAMLLSLDGHVVETVHSGEAALDAVASFKADAILLDIGLPRMDGYEVASNLRASGFDGALIALTGYGQKEDVERALNAGFDAHMAKPLEYGKLQEILAEMALVAV